MRLVTFSPDAVFLGDGKAKPLVGLNCWLIVCLDIKNHLLGAFIHHTLQASAEKWATQSASTESFRQSHHVDLTESRILFGMPFKPVKSRQCRSSLVRYGAVIATPHAVPQEKYISRIKPLSFHTAL